MRSILLFFSKFISKNKVQKTSTSLLDYTRMIHLDAENLAEQGIADAYQKLLPYLREFIKNPAELSEFIEPDIPIYKIQCNGQEYLIYSAEEAGTEEASWGRATYFFFLTINKQLADTNIQFYAINGGNDLGGFFLSPEQIMSAKNTIPHKKDWPYIPELYAPWYGQPH